MLLESLTLYQAKRYLYNVLNKYNSKIKLSEKEVYFLSQIEYYVEQEIIGSIRKRQKSITGLKIFAHGKKTIWGDNLTPGCSYCLDGTGLMPIRSVSSCNLNCKFCYYFGEEVPELLSSHYKIGNNLYTLDDIKMLIDKQGKNHQAITWVFFEPFVEFEKHPEIIRYIHDKGIYQHMYTNGTLCTEEQFKILRDCGLEEMRFDLAATNCSKKVLNTMKIARKYFNYLCIESPMYPDFYNSFIKNKTEILDIGIDQINFAELHLRKKHTEFMEEPIYRYKYGYISPVSSRQLTYNIIELAEKEKWKNITINDCSNETKYYRSFPQEKQLGENYWNAEIQLELSWYLKAISHFKIFSKILAQHNKNLPDGYQKRWSELYIQSKKVLSENNLGIKWDLSENIAKRITVFHKKNSSIELYSKKIRAQEISEYSNSSQLDQILALVQNGFMFKGIEFAIAHCIQEKINNEILHKKISNNNLSLEFQFAPDEISLQVSELSPEVKKELLKYRQNMEPHIKCIPYVNLLGKKMEYIPIQKTNNILGIQSIGNGKSVLKATVNGIYAALKNYVTYKIFKTKEYLPEINHEYFIGTHTYNNLKEIEQYSNKKIFVKDCSIGKNFPVFGLLVIDNYNMQFAFLIESNLHIEKAIDTMLTKVVDNEIIFTGINQIDSYPEGIYSTAQKIQKHYIETLKNESSYWPDYVSSVNEPSYHKEYLININLTINDELNQLLDILKKNSKTVYARRIDFLGSMPTVDIYIPTVTEILHLWDDKYPQKINTYTNLLYILNNIRVATVSQIADFTAALEDMNELFPEQLKVKEQFLYIKGNEWDDIDINIFLSMLFYRLKNFDKTLNYIKRYLLLNEKMYSKDYSLHQDKKYLNATLKYILFKKRKRSNNYISRKLTSEFGVLTANEVINDFYDPEKIFKHYKMPSIFNNPEESYFLEILEIVKKIQERQKGTDIKQEKLLKII